MFEVVRAAKRGLRDRYGFKPTGGSEHDPVFADEGVPDAEYPMLIDGVEEPVAVHNGAFDFSKCFMRQRAAGGKA